MNLIRALFVGLAAAAGSGCFAARPSGPDWFYYHAARNFTQKPIAHHDEKAFIKFVRRRAEAAWEDVCGAAGKTFSRDYADGFREGFVDYVEAGGTGEPPYLPPLRYRLTKNRTPDGVAAAGDWYAGFRHGATIARGSGLRELNYVPLPGSPAPADPARPELVPLPPVPVSVPTDPVPVMPDPVRPARPEPLPAPRPQMPPPVPLPVPAPAVGKVRPPLPAPLPQPAVRPAEFTKPGADTIPKPVVLLEHSEAPAPAPTPAPAPAAASDFTPWQPAPKPQAPTATRNPEPAPNAPQGPNP